MRDQVRDRVRDWVRDQVRDRGRVSHNMDSFFEFEFSFDPNMMKIKTKNDLLF